MKDPRMIFGFCLLAAVAVIAVVIALGHVSEATSYGLQIVLGSLATLCGAFAQWAFKGDSKENQQPTS